MFGLIKQVFIKILIFSGSLTQVTKVSSCTKYISLLHEPLLVRHTIINLNPIELKSYSFMVKLYKCNGYFNVLSPEICVPKETKDIKVKEFNLIAIKNEAKTMAKHTLCN